MLLGNFTKYLGITSPTLTNNVAEYTGLLIGLDAVETLLALPSSSKAANAASSFPTLPLITSLSVFGDSNLVVNQCLGRWKCNFPHLQSLLTTCQSRLSSIRSSLKHPPCPVSLSHVPRAENAAADALSNVAMDTGQSVTDWLKGAREMCFQGVCADCRRGGHGGEQEQRHEDARDGRANGKRTDDDDDKTKIESKNRQPTNDDDDDDEDEVQCSSSWTRHRDPTTGRFYFYSSKENTSKWEEAIAASPPLSSNEAPTQHAAKKGRREDPEEEANSTSPSGSSINDSRKKQKHAVLDAAVL